jgi:hypothetical protein
MRLRIRERWRTILGFEQRYAISDWGRARNLETGKILTSIKHKSGYLAVNLCDGKGNVMTHYLHRLTLTAFRGVCPVGMWARHLNGNRADNRLQNLEWSTPRRNARDKVYHGTNGKKLTVDDALEIRLAYSYADPAYPEPVIAMLAARYNVRPETIRDIVTRRRWRLDELQYVRQELRRNPAVRRYARQTVAKLAEQDCPEDADDVLREFDRVAGPLPTVH